MVWLAPNVFAAVVTATVRGRSAEAPLPDQLLRSRSCDWASGPGEPLETLHALGSGRACGPCIPVPLLKAISNSGPLPVSKLSFESNEKLPLDPLVSARGPRRY